MNRTEADPLLRRGISHKFQQFVCLCPKLIRVSDEHGCILHAGGCQHKLAEVAGFHLQTPHGRRKAVFLKACHSLRLMHVASWAISILTIHFNSRKMGMGMESIYAHVVRYAYMYHHVPSCTLKHSSKIPFVELFKC